MVFVLSSIMLSDSDDVKCLGIAWRHDNAIALHSGKRVHPGNEWFLVLIWLEQGQLA